FSSTRVKKACVKSAQSSGRYPCRRTNAYTGYQYASHRYASASPDAALVAWPAASTRLQRVVLKRPPRPGEERSGIQAALQLVEEERRRLRTFAAIDRQRPGKELLARTRQARQRRVRRRFADVNVDRERHRRKRMRPGQQFERDHRQRPQIPAAMGLLTTKLFGRHVERCAEHRAARRVT